ncbi:MAG TPA: NAD-dependent epimerase/dehydratase family protein [Gemmatimonadales bacterium]|nr:NAD-dependent epimerase/dehydratase family protein [Gemmatimonadales bacterium]
MGPVVLTGAGGFVGRRVLERLAAAGVADVRCLTRRPERLAALVPPLSGWRYLAGDFTDPAAGGTLLAGAETVLHLAAVTGKAPRRAYHDVNARGTEALVRAAGEAGAPRFILVSSVAAGFADRPHYHYAASKEAAERAVAASGLDYLVVRPTMVFGPGSPVQAGLSRLATLPAAVLFGTGEVLVQPVHVDDLAAVLVAALELRPLGGRVVTVGGPDRVRLRELLIRLRRAAKGSAGPVLRLPLEPWRSLLAWLEPIALGLLPITAGQLATFANDGVAAAPLPPGLPPPRRGLDEMLGL